MTEENDSELEKLLNQLDEDSECEAVEEAESMPEEVEPIISQEPLPPLPTAPEAEEPPPEILDPLPDEAPQIVTTAIEVSNTADEVLDVRALVKAHERDYKTISDNLARDRGKVDSVINMLMEKVQTGGSAAETESLVKALAVMTDTNGHFVRLLDSRSKLMVSAKSTIAAMVQTTINAGTGDSEDLKKILAQALQEDEDV